MSETPRAGEDSGALGQSEERFRLLVEGVRDYAIFMLDPGGYILTWNAGAERIKGYTAGEIIGQHFSRFYPPEALQAGLPAQELDVAKSAGSFEDEGWRVRKDGAWFWANAVITALRDASGTLLGFSKITRDLTQRRDHEESLRQSEERFRLLVEGVFDYAIFMLDVNGIVATWNAGAERIKGYAASEIIGKHFSTFYPADVRQSGWPEHELLVAAEKGSFADVGWRVRKNGTTFWAGVTITALHDSEGRLRGFAKLTRDLTEQKRAEALEIVGQQREEILEAERSARMTAQQATRIKDEFLATLSHELRTPLSSILGWTHILKRNVAALKPEDLQRGIDAIDRNARAQARLIDDLLDLSRIMSGKVRLDVQQLSMLDIVQSAIESAEPAAKAKDIRLAVILDTHPATVTADGGRLQHVIWNLLSNAIKFTPKGGQIRVLLQRVNACVELSVSDTGIGIPASFLPHVFDRFSQKDASTTRSYGGLGLGLAISRQLVELHEGSIRAMSEGEGQGATFVVELPLSIVQLEAEDPARAHPAEELSCAESLSPPRLAGVHVLVVDDEADGREMLQRVLEEQAATVTAVSSAQQALDVLKEITPNVIVSDIGMPETDGYQLMRTLRAGETRDERIPAVALTALARAEDRKRTLVAGYQAHLAKPFDVAELVLVVADLAGR
ncbi:MAG TPA: PAS domain S-box protein [Caldimonas sp.]|nr:PAS domain S-box protein [Caldimonas sp.]